MRAIFTILLSLLARFSKPLINAGLLLLDPIINKMADRIFNHEKKEHSARNRGIKFGGHGIYSGKYSDIPMEVLRPEIDIPEKTPIGATTKNNGAISPKKKKLGTGSKKFRAVYGNNPALIKWVNGKKIQLTPNNGINPKSH